MTTTATPAERRAFVRSLALLGALTLLTLLIVAFVAGTVIAAVHDRKACEARDGQVVTISVKPLIRQCQEATR